METKIFEANLAAIEASRPELLSMARQAPPSSYVVQKDNSGRLNLLEEGKNITWYPPSVNACIDRLKNIPHIERYRLIALWGLGLGHELLTLLELQNNRTLLVIEPDPNVFRAAIRYVDLSSVLNHPHVQFQINKDVETLKVYLYKNTIHARYLFFSKSVKTIITENVHQRYPDYVRQTLPIFHDAIANSVRMCGNDPEDVLTGLKHILHNLPLCAHHPNIWALKDILKDRPALVVSAGPSLKQSLPHLVGIQNKIPIFCPDTSVPILLKAGIRPHVAASKERNTMSVQHFEAINSSEVALACCPVLRPYIFELHHGPKAFIYRSADFYHWLQPEGELFEFDGSAGNLAYRLALLAGCNPIVLVGQDLCLADDGQTHADGTATGSFNPFFKKEEGCELPGNRGGIVHSTPRWISFLRQFEVDIATHKTKVYNATAHGAHIEGTEVVDLSRILSQLQPGPDPKPIISSALKPRSQHETHQLLQHFKKRLNETKKAVHKTRDVLKIGKTFSQQCLKDFKPPEAKLPNLDLLIREPPYLTLDGVRQKSMEGKIFIDFSTTIIQALLMAIEIDRYAQELEAKDANTLGQIFIRQYHRWFHEVDGLLHKAETLIQTADRQLAPKPRKKSKRAKPIRAARNQATNRIT